MTPTQTSNHSSSSDSPRLPLNPLSMDATASTTGTLPVTAIPTTHSIRRRRRLLHFCMATVTINSLLMGCAFGFSPDLGGQRLKTSFTAKASLLTTSTLPNPTATTSTSPLSTASSSSSSSSSSASSSASRRSRTRTKKSLKTSSSASSSSRSTSASSGSHNSVLHPLQPLTSISAERRRNALKAMDRNNNNNNKMDASSSSSTSSLQQQQQGVDATMLQLLSGQFLYHPMATTGADGVSSSSTSTTTTNSINNNNNNSINNNNNKDDNAAPPTRPRGRPEFVPGAMNYETMLRFRERRNQNNKNFNNNNNNNINNNNIPVMAPAFSYHSVDHTNTKNLATAFFTPPPPRPNDNMDNSLTDSNGKQRRIKGSSSSLSTDNTLWDDQQRKPILKMAEPAMEEPAVVKTRKRVVKNLPEPRSRPTMSSSDLSDSATYDLPDDTATSSDDSSFLVMAAPPQLRPGALKTRAATSSSSSQTHNINLTLFKYYHTELLSAQEEYSLGIKTQFLMKCEQVHEGLAAYYTRLPTFEEWAAACGFNDQDSTFVPSEADEQLRPAGSDSLFDEIDPHMFIGNGPASAAGPGRGRGRVKRPPPLKLGNFYDDTPLRFTQAATPAATDAADANNNNNNSNNKKLDPMNQGSVTDFVEMLMDCKAAKQRMVQCNMRLVISIARKYANVGVNLQDLVQEGSLGLTRAAEKFEPTKGFKFSTYASWWIQQAVFRSIAYHSRTIRLPVHVHNLLNRVRKVRMALERDLGRKPTNEEMATQLGMSLGKYNKMIRLTKSSISLEIPKYQSNPKDLGHESDDLLGDTIDASSVVLDDSSPEKRVDRGLFHDDLKEMLKILDEEERRVICLRYGLADGLTRTVTAVAAQMKESKAWVRSQECRALRKLRRPWYEKKLKEHQDALTS